MTPYKSYNQHLQNIFGYRVYKVSIDAGFSCPNRDGRKGLGGCTFCDANGSSALSYNKSKSIREQVIKNILKRREKYSANKFIAYFQSYTNTYAPISDLKKMYDEAIDSDDDIVGLSVSTRPDCVDEDIIKLISSYKDRLSFVSIEYGVQTIHDKTLSILNRGETHSDFLKAFELTKKYDIHCCAHVILGLPGESWEDQMATAEKLAQLNIDGVKIHILVATEGTPIAEDYLNNKWKPLDYREQINIICDFLERLNPNCTIHRIGGNGHPANIVAPSWIVKKRSAIINDVSEELINRNSYQGRLYLSPFK